MKKHQPLTKRAWRKLLVVGGSMLLALILYAGYVVASVFVNHQPDQTSPVVQRDRFVMEHPCQVPDSKFCNLRNQLVRATELQDFSLLIASESTASVCQNTSLKISCDASPPGNVPQKYPLQLAGKSQYVSRNEYIALLRQYADIYGSFVFAHEKLTENQDALFFRGNQESDVLTLQFLLHASGWDFTGPNLTRYKNFNL